MASSSKPAISETLALQILQATKEEEGGTGSCRVTHSTRQDWITIESYGEDDSLELEIRTRPVSPAGEHHNDVVVRSIHKLTVLVISIHLYIDKVAEKEWYSEHPCSPRTSFPPNPRIADLFEQRPTLSRLATLVARNYEEILDAHYIDIGSRRGLRHSCLFYDCSDCGWLANAHNGKLCQRCRARVDCHCDAVACPECRDRRDSVPKSPRMNERRCLECGSRSRRDEHGMFFITRDGGQLNMNAYECYNGHVWHICKDGQIWKNVWTTCPNCHQDVQDFQTREAKEKRNRRRKEISCTCGLICTCPRRKKKRSVSVFDVD